MTEMEMEYVFSKTDFQQISSYANRIFIERGLKYTQGYDGFLTECFIEAIKWFCNSRGLIIKNGKVFKV